MLLLYTFVCLFRQAPLAAGLEDLAELFAERSGAASGTSSASFSKSASFSAPCPQDNTTTHNQIIIII